MFFFIVNKQLHYTSSLLKLQTSDCFSTPVYVFFNRKNAAKQKNHTEKAVFIFRQKKQPCGGIFLRRAVVCDTGRLLSAVLFPFFLRSELFYNEYSDGYQRGGDNDVP